MKFSVIRTALDMEISDKICQKTVKNTKNNTKLKGLLGLYLKGFKVA